MTYEQWLEQVFWPQQNQGGWVHPAFRDTPPTKAEWEAQQQTVSIPENERYGYEFDGNDRNVGLQTTNQDYDTWLREVWFPQRMTYGKPPSEQEWLAQQSQVQPGGGGGGGTQGPSDGTPPPDPRTTQTTQQYLDLLNRMRNGTGYGPYTKRNIDRQALIDERQAAFSGDGRYRTPLSHTTGATGGTGGTGGGAGGASGSGVNPWGDMALPDTMHDPNSMIWSGPNADQDRLDYQRRFDYWMQQNDDPNAITQYNPDANTPAATYGQTPWAQYGYDTAQDWWNNDQAGYGQHYYNQYMSGKGGTTPDGSTPPADNTTPPAGGTSPSYGKGGTSTPPANNTGAGWGGKGGSQSSTGNTGSGGKGGYAQGGRVTQSPQKQLYGRLNQMMNQGK